MMDPPTHNGLEGNNSCEGVNDEAVKELRNTYQERLTGVGTGCLIKGKGKANDMLSPLPPNAKRFRPPVPGDFTQGMLPPFPPNAQRFRPPVPGDFTQGMLPPLPPNAMRFRPPVPGDFTQGMLPLLPPNAMRFRPPVPGDFTLGLLPPLPPNAQRFRPPVPDDFTQGSAPQTMVGINPASASSQCIEVEDVSTESDTLPTESNEKEIAEVTRDFVHSVGGHDKSYSSNDCSVDFLGSKGNKVEGQEHLDKACSCSFCLQAAHMWTDLTLQDTRDKLSELQKSKERTKDCINKVIQDGSKVSKPSELETNLLQQWTALFQHTHDTLDQEIARTQSKLEEQSKLTEKCKNELELRSNVFPHK